MNQLNNIYKKNGFFIILVFIIGFSIPYTQEYPKIQSLIKLVGFCLYIWNGYLLTQVIRVVYNKQSSIHELKFLYMTLCVTCAGGYFYFGVMDSKETTIAGIRAFKAYSEYKLYTFDGAFNYFKDLFDTYLNSLYYSVVVMGTLGDSVISVKGGFARFIVGFEVATALTITVFKIGEYFSEKSSKEAKMSEKAIVDEIKRINAYTSKQRRPSLFKRSFQKLCSLF